MRDTVIKGVEVIRATLSDVDQLQNIGRETFSETFAAINTPENMSKYLAASFSKEKLRAELFDSNAEIYFAVLGKRIVGYLKVNTGQSQTELCEDNALEIERIYVLKEFLGKNVGQILLQKAIEIARTLDVDYVWLGVWENNDRARAFYRKNHFVDFSKHSFKLGDDEQTDIMMKLILKQT